MVDCVSAVADSAAEMVVQPAKDGEPSRSGATRTYYLTDITDRIEALGKRMYGCSLSFQFCDF